MALPRAVSGSTCVPGPAAPATPGNLLEMRYLRARFRPTESEALGVECSCLCPPRGSTGLETGPAGVGRWLAGPLRTSRSCCPPRAGVPQTAACTVAGNPRSPGSGLWAMVTPSPASKPQVPSLSGRQVQIYRER